MQFMKYGTGFRNALMKKNNFSFVKDFLGDNEITESVFWERLATLEIKWKTFNEPLKKGNSFLLAEK